MSRKNIVHGLLKFKQKERKCARVVYLEKHYMDMFLRNAWRENNLLKLIHSYLCYYMPKVNIGIKNCMFILVDDFIRCMGLFLKNNSVSYRAFKMCKIYGRKISARYISVKEYIAAANFVWENLINFVQGMESRDN